MSHEEGPIGRARGRNRAGSQSRHSGGMHRCLSLYGHSSVYGILRCTASPVNPQGAHVPQPGCLSDASGDCSPGIAGLMGGAE
jgi:hypothetical protein